MALTKKQLKDIARFKELEPLYNLAIEQAKNELIESDQFVNVIDLPNGEFIHLVKTKAYDKTSLDQKKIKAEYADVYNACLTTKHYDVSAKATHCTAEELQKLLENNAKYAKKAQAQENAANS